MSTIQEPNAVDFMSRHFVALLVDYDSIERDGRIKHSGTVVLSGWLLEVRDTCYWVTAGHCLKESLDQHISDGYIRVTGGGFMDYMGHEARYHTTYPFTYEPGCGIALCKFDSALDFALVPVDSLTRAAFLKNRNIPVTREHWLHAADLKFDFFRMLGIPEDRVCEPRSRTEMLTVQPVMLGVDRIDYEEAKDIPHVKSSSWFFARIPPEVSYPVIKGMSGGPIYGFRRDSDGVLKYHIVALQSWWDEKHRVIFGCPIHVFAEALHAYLEPSAS